MMELKWKNDGHKWAVIEVIAEKKPKNGMMMELKTVKHTCKSPYKVHKFVVSSQPCIESYLYNLLSFLKNEK